MAKIQFGVIVTGARGHIGGIVFSANKAGPYAKVRTTPSNPRALNQQNQRATLSSMGAAWRDLSDSQRDDWDAYAADAAQELIDSMGEPYYASGFNWFVSINVNLTNIGRATRDDAPTTGTPATPTLSGATITDTSPDTGTITYPTNQWSGFDMIVDLCIAGSVGRMVAVDNKFRNVLRKQAPVGAASEQLTGITDAFGQIIEDQRFFIRAYRQSSQGRRSAPAVTSGLIT